MYAIVETKADLPRYVRMRPEIAATMCVGDKVEVAAWSSGGVKSSDQRIARFAQDHGAIYDPAAHQRAPLALPRQQVEYHRRSPIS